MKLKRKLFSILSSSILALSTVTIAVACAKEVIEKKDPEEEDVEGLDIGLAFNGVKNISTNNITGIEIGQFSLSRAMGSGEQMKVFSTSSDIVIESAPSYPTESFKIKVGLASGQAPTADTVYKFDLVFKFAVNGVEQAMKKVRGFTLNYFVDWVPKTINWNKNSETGESYAKSFVLPEGRKQITLSNYFVLTDENPDWTPQTLQQLESVRLTNVAVDDTDHMAAVSFEQQQMNGSFIPVTFTLDDTGCEYTDDKLLTTFTATFEIVWNGQTKADTIKVSNISITLTKPWVAPTITYGGFAQGEEVELLTGHTVDDEKKKGSTSYYFDSWKEQQSSGKYFQLSRKLSEGEEIKAFSDNPNIDVTCQQSNDSSELNDEQPYLNLNFKFNNILDPYQPRSEKCHISLLLYHEGNLVECIEFNNFTFRLIFNNYEDPEVGFDNYAVTFNSVELDTDGDGTIRFIGNVVCQNEREGTVTYGLKPGHYMTAVNKSYGEEGPEGETNEYTMVKPKEMQGLPVSAISSNDLSFGPNGEFEFEISNMATLRSAVDIQEWLSNIEIKFFDHDPIPEYMKVLEGGEEPTPIDTVESYITFIYYPPGFWTANSTDVTDDWIKQRTFLLDLSYNKVAGNPLTKENIYTNAWVVGQSESLVHPEGEEGILSSLSSYVAMPWDVRKRFDEVLNNDDKYLKDHDVQLKMCNAAALHKYNAADKRSYITEDDFLDLMITPVKGYEDWFPEGYRGIVWEDKQTGVWDWNPEQPGPFNGTNIAIANISLAPELILHSDEVFDYIDEYLNYMSIYVPQFTTIDDWALSHRDEDGEHPTSYVEDNGITSWNEWASGVCSGFAKTTINVGGFAKDAFYWDRHDISFTSGDYLEYKTKTDSAQQGFAKLDAIDGKDINHISPAYRLPYEYSTTDVDNGWFCGDIPGAMFVIRAWLDEARTELDIPRVAGINWNGGERNSSWGDNKIVPWIDVFWNQVDGNLIEDYI